MNENNNSNNISAIVAWSLAFGCVIGWGSFVMPGTAFLPEAGPIGTLIGLIISAVMILAVGVSYVYLFKNASDEIGTYQLIRKKIGEDHAFLAIWSLGMAYISLLWANATAFVLIGRYFVGDVLQFGFYYRVAGYDVYGGEVLATIAVMIIFGLLEGYAKTISEIIRTIFAVVLFASVIILFFRIILVNGLNIDGNGFATDGVSPGIQVLNIAMLAPWLFVGFETVTDESGARRLSSKTLSTILASSIFAGMLVYILLALTGASGASLSADEFQSMPVFYSVKTILGNSGFRLLGLAAFCALSTSVFGFYHAAANIIKTMSENGLLPAGLSKEQDGVPRNAIWCLMIISMPIAFLGRTAVGWNADVSTLSVAIVYVYISICAFLDAKKENNTKAKISAIVGMISLTLVFLFLLVPNIISENGLATESYLMLGVWSLAGTIYYWIIFRRDNVHRFGKSTIMWIMMLFLFFFSTNVWMRLYEQDKLAGIMGTTSDSVVGLLMGASVIQMLVVVIALFVLFSLFATMLKREGETEKEKMQAEIERNKAEESSKAKSVFLSNMSHDIRTPMNAIIGYVNLSKQEGTSEEDLRDYMSKIETSSQHLLALINDVLEMSRIESGKMDLEPIPVDLKKTLSDVQDMFSTQMEAKNIDFHVDTSQVKNSLVYCDKNRLNRVLLNLLSNAYKFTPENGSVTVSLWQIDDGDKEYGSYELRVADSGIGMTKEFAEKVFEAFERERTSTVSGIQGTGLGMAITKSIIDLMGGTIEVHTAPNAGTEFVIHVKFKLQEESESVSDAEEQASSTQAKAIDFSTMRVLLVEDMMINREIAKKILANEGFTVETAENGKEAVDKVAAAPHGYFDFILMDIQMPVLDGYGATKAIRDLSDKELANIPIIAMTANAFSEDVKKALDVGMNGHIAKPIDIDNMLSTIKEVLAQYIWV